MMHGLLELETCQPPTMQLRPGWPMIVKAMTQQEARQLLTGLAQCAHRRLTRTNKIAHRLVRLIRHPDRRQFTSPVQLSKVDRVSPVGLDSLAWLSRDQR